MSTWKATAGRFRARLQDGLEGIVSKAEGLALPLRALAGLAQDEEPGLLSGEREAEEGWDGNGERARSFYVAPKFAC